LHEAKETKIIKSKDAKSSHRVLSAIGKPSSEFKCIFNARRRELASGRAGGRAPAGREEMKKVTR